MILIPLSIILKNDTYYIVNKDYNNSIYKASVVAGEACHITVSDNEYVYENLQIQDKIKILIPNSISEIKINEHVIKFKNN